MSTPVCVRAARALASVRPTLQTTTGTPLASARSSAARNAAGLRAPSMKTAITRVVGRVRA